jgi:hypothetical protein
VGIFAFINSSKIFVLHSKTGDSTELVSGKVTRSTPVIIGFADDFPTASLSLLLRLLIVVEQTQWPVGL